jgi:hypothetical protein
MARALGLAGIQMERTKYQILRALEKRPMSFWRLIRSQDSTLSTMTQTIGIMLKEKEIAFDPESRKFSLQKPSGIAPQGNGFCPTCQGKGLTLDDRFEEALERFRALTTDRPPPIFEYNQGIIDPRDLALKSSVIYQRGDLEGRSMLLLGDDDLFSIFLAILGFPCTVTALEIDERLIRYINEKARINHFAITARRYDVNTPLPDDLRAAGDTFVTEPPEGLTGMLLFLGRAIDGLGPRGVGYFGLTTLESSLSKWLAIQKFLLEKRMVITDLLRNFSLYPEAGDPIEDYAKFPISIEFPVDPGPPDVDYFRASLIRVEKTDRVTIETKDGFYTDEDTLVTVNPEDSIGC